MVLSVLSFFDQIENTKFIQNCPAYSIYKYLLLTKISLLLTILSSLSGIIKRLTGNENRFYSLLLASSSTLQTIVFILFWGLLFFDKKMVIDPDSIKNHSESSLWNRFCSHVIPFILAYLNIHDFNLKYEDRHIKFFFLFGIIYYGLTSLYTWNYHRQVYPLLSKLNYLQKVFLFLGVVFLAITIYFINLRIFKKQQTNIIKNRTI